MGNSGEILEKLQGIATFITRVEGLDLANLEVKLGLTAYKHRKLDEYLFNLMNEGEAAKEKATFTSTPEIKLTLSGVNFLIYKSTQEEKVVYKIDENGQQYMEME